MLYGNNLRELRTKFNLTQIQISKLLEIGQAEYSRIESGKRRIYPHKSKLAEILKVTPDDIKEFTQSGELLDKPPQDQYLSVYGFPLPDGKGFDFTQQMMSKVDRPDVLSGVADAYACFCFGECLAPQINNGDIAFVNPSLNPKEGGLIVLRYQANEKDRGLLCRYVGQKSNKVFIEWRDGEETFDFDQVSINPVVSVQYAL
jgi:transcriptional regulator with XRE-family HTH domain